MMFDPILAEDSTIIKLVDSLEGIVKDLKEDATRHDYLVALLIVFLAESGFYVSTPDSCNSQCLSLKSLRIPINWKSKENGFYDMKFRLATCPDVLCKFIAIPSGDTLIVNFFSLPEKTIYTIALRCMMYVNPFSTDLAGRYRNVKDVSHRFKDKVVTPVRSDILAKAGVMGPSLENIPFELQFKILHMLDKSSFLNLAKCSSKFRRLCESLPNRRS